MKWMTYIASIRRFSSLNTNTKNELANIGQIHEQAVHNPGDPATKSSYDSFKHHVLNQYNDLKNQGMKFHFTPNEPYTRSHDMRNDAANKQLKVYNVDDLQKDHPLAEMAPGTKQNYNSLFRAVHDIHGHANTGHEFGPKGELKAYQAHSKMFPKEALPALASETLGQNAWVNYGPHNPQSMSPQERPYAPQKAYAFPQDIAEKMVNHNA